MTDPAVPALVDETSELPDYLDADGTVDDLDGTPVMSPVVPDRADAPVSVITERFFRAIIEHVPLDRIEELHLFSPLKQGGSETGIAVIAARVPLAVETRHELTVPELSLEVPNDSDTDGDGDGDVVDSDVVADGDDIIAEVSVDVDAGDSVDFSVDTDADADAAVASAVTEPDGASAVAGPLRHTVYTARYRLVQKGPERGKWEADVVAEAEAPLLTVEMVVRGVQRRAGEEGETLRFSAAQLAKVLQLP